VDTSDLSGLGWRVMVGSCLDRMKDLPDASVDAVVTDPPYELGFMGKSWDSSGIAFNTAVWLECLRVLKPGGHLLAFGGSRTWHRIAVAVEDAGFQIRDSVAWLYGSGFPKSLDVSKAIDKSDAVEKRLERNFQFTEWIRSTGMTARQIDDITNTKMGSHYTTHPTQPAIATADLFDKLRAYLPEVPEHIERLVAERTVESENYKNREVVGKKTSGIANKEEGARHTIGASQSVEVDITVGATDDAVKWQGWGTALKPAFEPVIVARKPLVGTVAANVLEFGTGGLNIDGTRISGTTTQKRYSKDFDKFGNAKGKTQAGNEYTVLESIQGRWPSNVVLDEFTAGLVDEQSGVSFSKAGGKSGTSFASGVIGQPRADERGGHNDSGGASRFFYVAKASKRDRNEGLDGLEERESLIYSEEAQGPLPQQTPSKPSPRQNFHPTVKPTDLMRQLVRLVTPPGGVVLDPFTGSGSTGKAAILEGFEFIGCELTEEYLPIIEGRLNHAVATVKAEREKEEEKLF
jgi:DNA modification methylase